MLTNINTVPNVRSERFGYNDNRQVECDKVHHEERQGGDGREEQLMAPPQVQYVICKPQEYHAADGQQGC